MKLLRSAVKVKIPAFQIASEDGPFEIDFSIVFKRQDEKERKKRFKRLMKSAKNAKRLSDVLSKDDVTEEEVDAVQADIDASEAEFDKHLFEDIIGWDNLIDIDGSEEPYSVKTKKELLGSTPFREAILAVWNMASGGVTPEAEQGADRKN